MVKLTIVGRLTDALPLAKGPTYLNEDNDSFSSYQQQGEFLLKEISRGALPPSKMTIRVDHQSFNYSVENGICFITLCDSSYPRKLAFHYLQDLQKEFGKFDISLVERIRRPYSFVKFDSIIGNIRKRYIDTRTQANLSKLNANHREDLEIITEHMSEIVERRRHADQISDRTVMQQSTVSSIWGSPHLEAIALVWTPITIIVVTASVLLWIISIITDDFFISSL